MTRSCLLAIDGSKQARHAFNWHLNNIHKEGDHIILVHVAEYNINIGLPGKAAAVDEICAAVKKRNDEIGNMTDEFMNILRAKHISAKLLVLQGDKPGELIVKAAEDEKVESITMGCRGLGTIRRTLMGSSSEYVVHHAHCAVTVVRQSD